MFVQNWIFYESIVCNDNIIVKLYQHCRTSGTNFLKDDWNCMTYIQHMKK